MSMTYVSREPFSFLSVAMQLVLLGGWAGKAKPIPRFPGWTCCSLNDQHGSLVFNISPDGQAQLAERFAVTRNDCQPLMAKLRTLGVEMIDENADEFLPIATRTN